VDIRAKYDLRKINYQQLGFLKRSCKIINFLFNRNINAQNNKGYTPLHIAARNNLPELASALLRYGASSTIVDNNGQTAKQVAAYLDYTHIVNIIDAS
jgi:ankyrin repeat protein